MFVCYKIRSRECKWKPGTKYTVPACLCEPQRHTLGLFIPVWPRFLLHHPPHLPVTTSYWWGLWLRTRIPALPSGKAHLAGVPRALLTLSLQGLIDQEHTGVRALCKGSPGYCWWPKGTVGTSFWLMVLNSSFKNISSLKLNIRDPHGFTLLFCLCISF